MKKDKVREEKVKNIKVLSEMNIDLKTKRKLQNQAKNWVKYLNLNSENINLFCFLKLFNY